MRFPPDEGRPARSVRRVFQISPPRYDHYAAPSIEETRRRLVWKLAGLLNELRPGRAFRRGTR